MLFWCFMLAMVLLIPLTMILFGRDFRKGAPADINRVFGYRSGRSMKNRDAWEFAHRLIGKIWYRTGLILLPVSAGAMCFFIGKGTGAVGWAGAAIVLLQMIPLVGSIVPVERALKKEFDEYGFRRK